MFQIFSDEAERDNFISAGHCMYLLSHTTHQRTLKPEEPKTWGNLLKHQKIKACNLNILCNLRRLGSSGFLSSNPQAAGSNPARRVQ